MNIASYAVAGAIVAFGFSAMTPDSRTGLIDAAQASPALVSRTEIVAVNRDVKGDRLTAAAKPAPAREAANPDRPPVQTRQRTPIGCETVFSPLSVSSRLNVVGKCVS